MFNRFTIILLAALFWMPGYAQTPELKSASLLGHKQPNSSLVVLKKLHAEAVEKNDLPAQGKFLQQMGQICYNQGYYAQAMEFYLQSDQLFTSIGDSNLLAENMGQMGILLYYNKQSKEAHQAYNKALVLYKQTKNLKGQASILGGIGHLYEKSHRYDSAFYYQKQALKKYTEASFPQGAAKIYENLGSIYEDLEQYDSAYVAFNKSLALYKTENNEIGAIEVVNNLGDILRKTRRYPESILLSRRAMAMARQTDNLYQLAACAKDLGKAYGLLNQMDSAYHYAEASRKFSLEAYSKEGVDQTAFLQVLYDINKKSAEIDRLNNVRKMNAIIAIGVVIIAVLLVVLGIVVLSRYRLKIKDQNILAKQKEVEHNLIQLELKNQHLQEEGLKQELELKSKELSTHTLNLIKNNQFLEQLRSTLQAMVKDEKRDQKKQMQQIITEINESFNHEQHWREFTQAFEQVHQQFFDSLKQYSTELTSTDLRLVALLKMNLDSADIATLLDISTDSLRVSRYRLRKKLNIPQGDNLSAFIQSL